MRRRALCLTMLLATAGPPAATTRGEELAPPGDRPPSPSPSPAAHAPSPSQAGPPGRIRLDEVTVTATRLAEPTFDVPRAVTVVTQDDVVRQTPFVASDLLRGQTGVFVQQTTPGQGTPIVRGLIGSGVLHLVDGMRLNNAIFRFAPNQYFSLVDAQNVERIEVVRGAGSTLYGSDAMGGVVNVLTPEPRFTGDDWQLGGRTLGQLSSANRGGVTRTSLAGGRRGVGLTGGFTYETFGDLRGGAGEQSPTGYDIYAADGKGRFEGERLDAMVNVQYLRQPRTPRFDEVTPGFGQTEPSSAVFLFEPNDRLFLHGRFRLQQPAPFVERVQLDVSYQDIDDDRRSRAFGSTREDRERNESRLIGVTLQLLSVWRDWMTLTYGLDVYLDAVDSTRIGRDIETQAISRRAGRFADGSTQDSYGFYLQDEIRLHRRLTLLLGGRVSYFDTSIAEADRGVGTDQRTTDVTGNAGLVFHLTESVNLVGNVGRGFRVPNVFDLSTLGPRPGNRFSIPNGDLGPEQILTYDAGVKYQSPRLAGEVFGFYSDYDDKIEEVPTGAITEDGRTVVRSANLNTVTLYGVEAGARVHLPLEVELVGVLNYTRGTEELPDGSKGPADRIPPLNGRLGLVWRPSERVWVEPFLGYAARQDRLSARDLADPRIDLRGTPGWVTVNVRAGWDVSRYLQVRAALENIADEAYRAHGSGVDAPGIGAIVAVEARF
jgi:hemoglobin/transferrin/lactoferrin receptor protein